MAFSIKNFHIDHFCQTPGCLSKSQLRYIKKLDWLTVIFISTISILTLKDLFLHGLFTSHDGPHQIVRAFYYHQLLFEGQIPPRWVGGLNFGFGYPLFIFSYHLPWWINEIFLLLKLNIIDAVKMTFLTGFMVSGISMYLFQKRLFGRLAAFVGSIIYLFAPFRFVNIFVRAALGEATAFIFPPVIFLSLVNLGKSQDTLIWSLMLALSLSGLLLSHAMIFVFYLLAVGWYMLATIYFTKTRLQLGLKFLYSFLLFIGISAFYLLPSFGERGYTKFRQIMEFAFTDETFAPLSRLLYEPWGFGAVNAVSGRMSLQVGLAQWLSVILAVLWLLITLFKNRKKPVTNLWPGIFFPSLFLLGIYLVLPISQPIWQFIKKLVIIDYVWRGLGMVVVAASLSAGFLINLVKNKRVKLALSLCLVFLAVYANRNHWHINQSLDWPSDFYLQAEKNTTSANEYLPRFTNPALIIPNKPRVEFSGQIQMTQFSEKSDLLEFTANIAQAGTVRINTLYYPGWHVYVANKEVPLLYEKSGLLEFAVGPGPSQRISARFIKTPLRIMADSLTLVTIIYISYSLIRFRKND